MQKIKIGEVTIDAVIEREGPWRRPQDFFPAYDEATFKRYAQVMEQEVFDPASGMMFITYQTEVPVIAAINGSAWWHGESRCFRTSFSPRTR